MTTLPPAVEHDLEQGFTLLRHAPSYLRLKWAKEGYRYQVKAETLDKPELQIDLDRFNENQLYRAITRIYTSVSALYEAFPDKKMRSMIVAACLAEDHLFDRDVAGKPFEVLRT